MDCIFCVGLDPTRRVYSYTYWNLFIQLPEKLQTTRQSAGMLISKKHISEVTQATDQQIIELRNIVKDAANKLCVHTNTTYTGQEIVGFNQGLQAGQTIMHAHVHILPIAVEDPAVLKIRAGMGGAFEALYKERTKQRNNHNKGGEK